MSSLQVSMLLLFILNVLFIYMALKISNAVDTNADILDKVIKGFDESQKQVQRLVDHYNGTVDLLNSCITALDSTIDFCESLGCELQYEELDRDKLQEELDKFRSKIGVLYEDIEVKGDK